MSRRHLIIRSGCPCTVFYVLCTLKFLSFYFSLWCLACRNWFIPKSIRVSSVTDTVILVKLLSNLPGFFEEVLRISLIQSFYSLYVLGRQAGTGDRKVFRGRLTKPQPRGYWIQAQLKLVCMKLGSRGEHLQFVVYFGVDMSFLCHFEDLQF